MTRRHLVAPALAASLALAAYALARQAWGYDGAAWLDLRVYRGGVEAWLSGGSAYTGPLTPEGLVFTYPPFALLALAPLALPPFGAAGALLVLADAAALACVLLLAVRAAAPALRGRGSALATAVLLGPALLLEPVRTTLDYGQVNLLVLALVVADALAVPPRARGVLTGVAAGIKLVPLVFVVHFVATRQWRAAGATVGSFVAATALAAVLMPADTRAYWQHHLGDTERIGHVWGATNSSLRGLLARLADGSAWAAPLWLLGALCAVALAYAAAARAHAAGARLAALAAVGVLGLLASPVSWTHHWVWLPLLALALAVEVATPPARVLAGALLLAGYVGPMWLLPRSGTAEFGWTAAQHLLGDAYVLLAVAALLVLRIGWPHRPRVPAAEATAGSYA